MKTFFAMAPLALVLATAPVLAAEKQIGEPVEINGLRVAGVYLQAVTMEPRHHDHDGGDIHLEADIQALAGNPNGFAEDAWVPYLDIDFVLTKPGSDYAARGKLVPMVASDGPHYGANVKLAGPGKYHVAYTVKPPSHTGFLRHTDKETGVGAWWQPFSVEWDFAYTGTGKKGGY